jgi:hypothetical protein
MTAIIIILLIILQIYFFRSIYLFSRISWIDEFVVRKLVCDRDAANSLRATAGGLDTNPPVYHLMLRAYLSLGGHAGVASLRCVSFASVLAALAGLHVCLCQAYGPLVAAVAVLAVWGHPLVLRYAFEARMYGAWLAAVVWFSYALGRSWEQPAAPWIWALLACTSFLASALHTLGPLALTLVLLSQLLAHSLSQWSWYRLGLASIGALAFLAWAPVVWRQNLGITTTWAETPSKWGVYGYLNAVLFPGHLAAVVVVGGLASFLTGMGEGSGLPAVIRPDSSALAGLAGLALMPFALVAISFSVMPLLSERFALPAVASLSVAAAAMVSRVPGPWLAALCGLLYVTGGINLNRLLASYREEEGRVGDLIAAIRTHTGGEPVFFEDIYYLQIVYHHEAELSRRSFAIDYEGSEIGEGDAYLLAARDFNRLFCRYYSIPRLARWAEVSTATRLFLVLPQYIQRGFFDVEGRYPGFRALPIEAGLYQLVATRAPAEAAQGQHPFAASPAPPAAAEASPPPRPPDPGPAREARPVIRSRPKDAE